MKRYFLNVIVDNDPWTWTFKAKSPEDARLILLESLEALHHWNGYLFQWPVTSIHMTRGYAWMESADEYWECRAQYCRGDSDFDPDEHIARQDEVYDQFGRAPQVANDGFPVADIFVGNSESVLVYNGKKIVYRG